MFHTEISSVELGHAAVEAGKINPVGAGTQFKSEGQQTAVEPRRAVVPAQSLKSRRILSLGVSFSIVLDYKRPTYVNLLFSLSI